MNIKKNMFELPPASILDTSFFFRGFRFSQTVVRPCSGDFLVHQVANGHVEKTSIAMGRVTGNLYLPGPSVWV